LIDQESYRRRTIEVGGSRPNAVRRRVLLIAAEKSLPEVDLARALRAVKYMRSRSAAWRARGGFHLIDFAGKHGISLDWLFFGDIRSLALMTSCPGIFAR
jgi:hypothetical protein